MREYGTTKQCPKCGETRYADAIVYGPCGGQVEAGLLFTSKGKDKFSVAFYPGEVEIMDITCSKCGYQFSEFPLDHGVE